MWLAHRDQAQLVHVADKTSPMLNIASHQASNPDTHLWCSKPLSHQRLCLYACCSWWVQPSVKLACNWQNMASGLLPFSTSPEVLSKVQLSASCQIKCVVLCLLQLVGLACFQAGLQLAETLPQAFHLSALLTCSNV